MAAMEFKIIAERGLWSAFSIKMRFNLKLFTLFRAYSKLFKQLTASSSAISELVKSVRPARLELNCRIDQIYKTIE